MKAFIAVLLFVGCAMAMEPEFKPTELPTTTVFPIKPEEGKPLEHHKERDAKYWALANRGLYDWNTVRDFNRGYYPSTDFYRTSGNGMYIPSTSAFYRTSYPSNYYGGLYSTYY